MLDLWNELSDQTKEIVLIVFLLMLLALVFFFLLRAAGKAYSWTKGKWIQTKWYKKARRNSQKLNLWHRWRVAMSLKQKRAAALNVLYGDTITDAFEDLAFRGIITRKELKQAYKRFGIGASIPSLISPISVFKRLSPRSKHSYPVPAQLKGAIKDRVENGNHSPVKLPDDDRPDSPLAAVFTSRI